MKLELKKKPTYQKRFSLEVIVLKHLNIVFEICIAILVLVFVVYYYLQLSSLYTETQPTSELITTPETSTLQLGQYEQVITKHQDKVSETSLVNPEKITSPFYTPPE